MTVSIIIAVKTWQKNLEECVSKCRQLDFSDFEIIILPDQPLSRDLAGPDLKIISTGPVSPGEKRDIAFDHARGEILAFIDDDAYPRKDWLENAIRHFADPQVAAVVGPAVTPPEDNFMQRASGRVYASILVSGNYVYRYIPKMIREVDDYPSCNFIVRKSIMRELGGFDTTFWPGEDTKLCLDITKKLGKKIIYDPAVLVFHHRRSLFVAHLGQIASYALHRGYFVKRYSQTSFRTAYFIPSLFLLFILAAGALSALFSQFRPVYILAGSFYLGLAFIFSISKDLRLIVPVFFGIILTHMTYGLFFIKGLFSARLKEENA